MPQKMDKATQELYDILVLLDQVLDFATPVPPGWMGIEDVELINETFRQALAGIAHGQGKEEAE